MIYFIGNQLFDFQDNNIKKASLQDCINYCKNKSHLAIDIETSRKYKKGIYKDTDKDNYKAGLDPFLSRVIALQIGDLNNQFFIDTRVIDPTPLLKIIEKPTIVKIGHNLKFECLHLKYNYNCNLQNLHDTFICERLLYNGEKISYSLENVAKRYVNMKISNIKEIDLFNTDFSFLIHNEDENEDYFEIDKSIRNDFINIGDKPFTLKQIKYGIDDIVLPFKIYLKQLEGRVIDNEVYLPLKAFKLQNALIPILANITLRGLTIDINGWISLYNENKKLYDQKKKKLDDYIVNNHPKFVKPPDLFREEKICAIDWQSPKQVIEFVKTIGECPKEKSKTTKRLEYTVGAKAVLKVLPAEYKDMFISETETEIVDFNSFLLNFVLFKKYQQLTTTFGLDWLEKYIHPITKKVHSQYIQLQNTGRMSSTSPNAQQFPSSVKFRKLIVPPEGYKMIATDFSAQEARIASDITKIKDFQQIFNEGHPIFKDDIHSLTATNMFKIIKNDPNFICDKNINKKERSTAKAMLFKLLFGGSDFTVAMDLGVELEEGRKFYNAFFDGFPGLRENFEDTKKNAVEKGWFVMDKVTESRYFYPYFNEMKEAYRKAMSYYPEFYKDLTKEQKENYKKELYIKYPEIKDYWKIYGTLKSDLERKALNYRIQGTAACQAKYCIIKLEENNFSLKEGLVAAVHDKILLWLNSVNCWKLLKNNLPQHNL